MLACDSSMTPSSSSLLICMRMASCFSADWCRGERRLRGASHFVRSISITIGSTCAGRDRTDVEKMLINSRQRLLSCSWSHGEPETLIMAMISTGVSGFTLSGRISNGSVIQSMSSSSAIGSSNWHLSMRVDSSIGVRSANVSAWGRRRRSYGT